LIQVLNDETWRDVKVRFNKRDLWVGVYWEVEDGARRLSDTSWITERIAHIYICVLPTFPIHLRFGHTKTEARIS
jgi:hypothetical protein